MSEPMSAEQLAEVRERGPVGYYCDHSDEPLGTGTHYQWEYVEGKGRVFQHMPEVVSCHTGLKDYLAPDQRDQRCPRALPVYDVDVPVLLAEVERLREELDRRAQVDAEALVDQTLMRELSVKDGVVGLDLVPPRELAAMWVHCARGMLGDAPNYTETPVEMPSVSMEVGLAGEVERYALIVQRVGKLTPHEARRQAEAERDRLRSRLEAAEHVMRRALAEVEHEEVVYLLNRYFKAAGK